MSAIRVRLKGFAEGEAEIRGAGKRFRAVAQKELQTFGNESVDWLKEKILGNDLGLAAKKRDNGQPPLVDSKKYVEGFAARVEGMSMHIESEGQNDFMPNNELTDLLEDGWTAPDGSRVPPRRHIAPLTRMMVSKLPELGQRISDAMFKGRR